MSLIRITSVKVGRTIRIGYVERFLNQQDREIATANVRTVRAVPHEDFVEAMNGLSVHFACVTEQLSHPEVMTAQLVASVANAYPVHELVIKEEASCTTYTLKGSKLLSNGEQAPLVARPIRFGDDGEEYAYLNSFMAAIGTLDEEVRALLDGKIQQSPQTSILDADQVDDEAASQVDFEELPI